MAIVTNCIAQTKDPLERKPEIDANLEIALTYSPSHREGAGKTKWPEKMGDPH